MTEILSGGRTAEAFTPQSLLKYLICNILQLQSSQTDTRSVVLRACILQTRVKLVLPGGGPGGRPVGGPGGLRGGAGGGPRGGGPGMGGACI